MFKAALFQTWPKACLCGASWSPQEWSHLVLVGYADGREDGELELRNCTCGSTLAVQHITAVRTVPKPERA